jgi:hypothetical protein
MPVWATFNALDRMTELGPGRIGLTLILPELSFIRDDPRVRALRKKAGLPEWGVRDWG